MRKASNSTTRLEADIKALRIGETLSHVVRLKLRQTAYDAARRLGIGLCIQELRTKRGRFEITRIR